MQYTERTPDNVIDALHNVPCNRCGGVGEVEMLPANYHGPSANTPYGIDVPCPACGGAGYEGQVWERVE